MNRGALAVLVVALALPAAAAPSPSAGAGAAATAGTGGYRRLSLLGDVSWQGRTLAPYLFGEYLSDTYVRQFTAGGGAWKTLDGGARVKGGVGLATGRVKDSDEHLGAFLLDAAAETDSEDLTLGADYRFSAGAVASAQVRGGEERLRERVRARGRGAEDETFTAHEIAGYARHPVGRCLLGLRLSLLSPSYAGSVVAETASLRVPVARAVWLTPALSFEQRRGGRDGVYGSLGLYAAFGGRVDPDLPSP